MAETKRRWPYNAVGGGICHTMLTPEEQVAVQEAYLRGDTLNIIVQNLDLSWHQVHSFVTQSAVVRQCIEAREMALAQEYAHMASQQFATAAEKVLELQALASDLLHLARKVIRRWIEVPPDTLSPAAMAKLLGQFLQIETIELKLQGINVESTQQTVRVVKEEAPALQLSVGDLLDAGMGIEDIDRFIKTIEDKKASQRPTLALTAPGPSDDESQPGAVFLPEGA